MCKGGYVFMGCVRRDGKERDKRVCMRDLI